MLSIKRLDEPTLLSRMDLMATHLVNIYRAPEAEARPAGAQHQALVPQMTALGLTGRKPVALRMRDNAVYVVFTDGSFRRVPKRRRFTFTRPGTGTAVHTMSGRQLRMLRKRVARRQREEQTAGTPVAAE